MIIGRLVHLLLKKRVDNVENNFLNKENEITELKIKLTNSGNAKERFNASADLAAMRLKEF